MVKRIVIIFVFVLLLVWYSVHQSNEISKVVESNSTETGSVLTELPDKMVKDLTGKEVSLRLFTKNKISVIHFWATWCGPCEAEFPELIKLANKVQKSNSKVQFVFIAVNDEVPKVKKFLSRFKNYAQLFSILIDNGGVHEKYFGTVRVPETYVFSDSYKTLKKFSGPQNWDNEFFPNYFNSLK